MRRAPILVAALFIFITLSRVADFSGQAMQAGRLGWVFSIAMGLGVFLFAYWTRISATTRTGEEDRRSRWLRWRALFGLVLFVTADGFFNLVEVLRSVEIQDRMVLVAAWTYGLFPTLAAALLGMLQGYVDRIPKPPRRKAANLRAALELRIVDLLGSAPQETQEVLPAPQAAAALPAAPAYVCEVCGKAYAKQTSLAAHMSHHVRKKVEEEVELPY